MSERMTNKQKVAKLVQLFNQIKELGFGDANLMVHNVPVLELGKEWKIEKEEGNSYGGGKYTYFTAQIVRENEIPEITLFSRNEKK